MIHVKKPKPVPTLPPDVTSGNKHEVAHYLINAIADNLGPTVASELLSRQLESCIGGVQAMVDRVHSTLRDPMAKRYQQILDERIAEAVALRTDHLGIFFIACQLYVTRVAESATWLKILAQSVCALLPTCKTSGDVRAIGSKVVGNLTIAVELIRFRGQV